MPRLRAPPAPARPKHTPATTLHLHLCSHCTPPHPRRPTDPSDHTGDDDWDARPLAVPKAGVAAPPQPRSPALRPAAATHPQPQAPAQARQAPQHLGVTPVWQLPGVEVSLATSYGEVLFRPAFLSLPQLHAVVDGAKRLYKKVRGGGRRWLPGGAQLLPLPLHALHPCSPLLRRASSHSAACIRPQGCPLLLPLPHATPPPRVCL